MSMSSSQVDLDPEHWKIVRDILSRHVPENTVLVFGSRASRKAKKFSDLDLAILGDNPQSLDLMSGLSEDFAESDLPFKVDLVDWALIDRAFQKIILGNCVTVQNPSVKIGTPAKAG